MPPMLEAALTALAGPIEDEPEETLPEENETSQQSLIL